MTVAIATLAASPRDALMRRLTDHENTPERASMSTGISRAVNTRRATVRAASRPDTRSTPTWSRTTPTTRIVPSAARGRAEGAASDAMMGLYSVEAEFALLPVGLRPCFVGGLPPLVACDRARNRAQRIVPLQNQRNERCEKVTPSQEE